MLSDLAPSAQNCGRYELGFTRQVRHRRPG